MSQHAYQKREYERLRVNPGTKSGWGWTNPEIFSRITSKEVITLAKMEYSDIKVTC